MSRLTRTLATASLAGLAITGLASAASAGVDPALNNPSNWEDGGTYSCSKVEYADGLHHADLPEGAAFLVVKAGTAVTQVYYDTHFDKDISYIITCYPTDTYPS